MKKRIVFIICIFFITVNCFADDYMKLMWIPITSRNVTSENDYQNKNITFYDGPIIEQLLLKINKSVEKEGELYKSKLSEGYYIIIINTNNVTREYKIINEYNMRDEKTIYEIDFIDDIRKLLILYFANSF